MAEPGNQPTDHVAMHFADEIFRLYEANPQMRLAYLCDFFRSAYTALTTDRMHLNDRLHNGHAPYKQQN